MGDAIDVGQDIVIPKPDHSIARRLKFNCSIAILLRLCTVLAAVNFDNQPGLSTTKVDYVPSYHDLTIEPHTVKLSSPKHLPQMLLGVR